MKSEGNEEWRKRGRDKIKGNENPKRMKETRDRMNKKGNGEDKMKKEGNKERVE